MSAWSPLGVTCSVTEGISYSAQNEILYVVQRQLIGMRDFTDLPFRRTTSSAGTNSAETMEQRTTISRCRLKRQSQVYSRNALVPAQKDRKVGRMVLILNILKLENKLVACRSANKSVQRLDPFVVDNNWSRNSNRLQL